MSKMTYQLLVSTMHQNDFSLCKKMRIDSNAIIINQCDHFSYEIKSDSDNRIEMYSFAERGVGLSRNSALMRSTADIIEFADDDMLFVDDYENKVLKEFELHPEADAILFSVESLNKARPLLKIDKFRRITRFGALKYGCARIAVKREKLVYANISFSLLFGGGARYGSGEDSLFLQDMIKSGLKIYVSPIKIADIKQESSSWFDGYTDKYYRDKGALFAAIFPNLCYLYALFTTLKQRKSAFTVLRLYYEGIIEFKRKKL